MFRKKEEEKIDFKTELEKEIEELGELKHRLSNVSERFDVILGDYERGNWVILRYHIDKEHPELVLPFHSIDSGENKVKLQLGGFRSEPANLKKAIEAAEAWRSGYLDLLCKIDSHPLNRLKEMLK